MLQPSHLRSNVGIHAACCEICDIMCGQGPAIEMYRPVSRFGCICRRPKVLLLPHWQYQSKVGYLLGQDLSQAEILRLWTLRPGLLVDPLHTLHREVLALRAANRPLQVIISALAYAFVCAGNTLYYASYFVTLCFGQTPYMHKHEPPKGLTWDSCHSISGESHVGSEDNDA